MTKNGYGRGFRRAQVPGRRTLELRTLEEDGWRRLHEELGGAPRTTRNVRGGVGVTCVSLQKGCRLTVGLETTAGRAFSTASRGAARGDLGKLRAAQQADNVATGQADDFWASKVVATLRGPPLRTDLAPHRGDPLGCIDSISTQRTGSLYGFAAERLPRRREGRAHKTESRCLPSDLLEWRRAH